MNRLFVFANVDHSDRLLNNYCASTSLLHTYNVSVFFNHV